MNILAVIPARGGSKRLPRKNVKKLCGKPLIVWSIDIAKNIPEICNILVSTDDMEIAAICEESGALVPWLRPAELATDTASSVDVALHALEWYEREVGIVDGLLLLQPTSPFRSKESIRRGIELFYKNDFQAILGVSLTHAHPMWSLKMEGDHLVPFMREHGLGTRSQDLPPAYMVNGGLYLISPNELRLYNTFMPSRVLPLIFETAEEAMDIDTELDWKVAESICG